MARPIGDQLARTMRTASGKADSRRGLMIAVRAACRRLGLDDDERKAVQELWTGKTSMADMTPAEIGKVLDHLNKGWTRGGATARPHIGKVRALWWSLYWLGAVGDPGDEALTAFVLRQTGISHLKFLDHRKAPSVIEALKSWAAREGVKWRSDEDIAVIAGHSNPDFDRALADRHAVLAAIAKKMHAAGLLDTVSAYPVVGHITGNMTHNHWMLSPREMDIAIAECGKRLRRRLAKDGADR